MAPEYATRGCLTRKADVYSYGVVTLEIVSGMSNINSMSDEEYLHLLDWVWHFLLFFLVFEDSISAINIIKLNLMLLDKVILNSV
jgi:hypothetical protein